jgi:hypothetical protein
MDDISSSGGNVGFFGHIFSTTEESKNEILNVVQYAISAIIPIIILNKTIQRFVPEADSDKSSIEIAIEILLQIVVMFVGIIFIHRLITYFPTYSGFKYERLHLTSIIIGFLIIIFSLQTKMGIKTNILVERLIGVWNGTPPETKRRKKKEGLVGGLGGSGGEMVDNPAIQSGVFPPAPAISSSVNPTPDYLMQQYANEPKPANDLVGYAFR